MRTRYEIIVLLLIISAVLLSTWWQDQKQRMYDRSLRSSYDYDVVLTTDSTLNNVTLYIPLPVINDTSYVGMDIIEQHFNNHDPSWEYSIVDTEHGLMVSMKNKKARSIDLSTMVLSDQPIDTMNPLNNEMILIPKYNLTQNVNASGVYSRTSEQFDYDSKMYAYYDASSNANVSISIYLNGRNEWWIGGWQYNSYWETMEVMLSGSQDGWTTVSGQLVTGEGTYDI
ncbi:hypothetical protein MSSIH_2068 [Methanosarcina siciliae HI350]|uniref:Uncharacterized protein n=1 Tax=Methanosarcina siciliae HI350 TaxID=1434119 RepID=A0A0E3PDZ9_9EURY|nr:hypothetical protein MSSIH_2068 [Methanosarcina siciliae HI350]